jgi:Glyoxalase-like domain
MRSYVSHSRDQDGDVAILKQLVVDSRSPSVLARFWAAALDDFEIRAYDDGEIARLAAVGRTPDTDPCVILDGPMLEICFQEVHQNAATMRPLHIDIESTDRATETEHLVSLGASVVEYFEAHTWMRDPEDNDFCVTDA